MMDYINSNMSGFWIALGFVMLAAEILIFGFTTVIFLFAGLGALIAGLLMSVGVIPETWIAGTACFGIATGISSAVLWKPLKAMQDKSTSPKKPVSDFVGLEFVLTEDISHASTGSYRYSGIGWKVEIDTSCESNELAKGQRVVVVSVDVGVFRVNKIA